MIDELVKRTASEMSPRSLGLTTTTLLACILGVLSVRMLSFCIFAHSISLTYLYCQLSSEGWQPSTPRKSTMVVAHFYVFFQYNMRPRL